MFDKLTAIEAKYEQLAAEMADPAVQADTAKFRAHSKALAEMQPLVDAFREYKTVVADLVAATEELLKDPDMRELAQEELKSLRRRGATRSSAELKVLLIPKDPNDEKNVILEIRAGAGGDEAALFASDLFRMYSRYAERQGWKARDPQHERQRASAGSRKSRPLIEGKGVYGRLKYESGVHRVQRVPRPRRAGASTRPPRRSPCCRKPRKWTSRSTPRTCGSTRSARAAPAARASTRRTPPSASPTSRPASSSRSRTRSRR